jgi:hypothetical protein
LNIVHFRDTNLNIVQINPEETTMQTIISQTTHSFADDAIALATGFKRITIGLATDALTAMAQTIMAPVDRLARACDVGGIIAARDAAKRRSRAGAASLRRRLARFDVFGICATFRGLRDLT